MKTDGNEPANPFLKWNEAGYGDCIVIYDANGGKQFLPYQTGLSKREYFASLIMQSLVGKYEGKDPNQFLFDINSTIAPVAVIYADELINALNK